MSDDESEMGSSAQEESQSQQESQSQEEDGLQNAPSFAELLNSRRHGGGDAVKLHRQQDDVEKKKKKKNKEAPPELSAKIQVSRYREAVHMPKKIVRDPRFESITGRLNEDLFRKTYSFLDDYKKKEMQQLRDEIRQERDEERRDQLQRALALLQQQIQVQKKKDEDARLRSEVKHAERERVKQGKMPYFMKKSEEKRLQRSKKYEELEAKGGLDKYLEKKLKRRAQKEHKRIPRERIDPEIKKKQRRF